MSKIRAAIDLRFEGLGIWAFRWRWLILVIVLGLTAFMVSRLPHTTFDMSTEAFLHEDDPSIIRYNEYRDQFGRDEMIMIAIKPKNVFDIDFLSTLEAFHTELEYNVPYLNDITSLINARRTTGTEGELIVEDLLEEMPETEEQMEALRESVLSNPFYKNLLVSEDGSFTTVVIKSDAYSSEGTKDAFETGLGGDDMFQTDIVAPQDKERIPLTNAENSKMITAVREIMDKYNSPEFPLYLTGSPVITDYLKKTMQKDMARFTLAAIVCISLLLYLLFRRLSGVAIPLLVVFLSVIYTFALMELTDTPLKLPLVILPSFLLAIGIGASVHLMAIFYKHYNGVPKREAVKKAMGHSGLPIAMTSLTTSAGLASFSQAELAPVADLGFFASIGVLISLVFTVFLTPALIGILPLKRQVKKNLPNKMGTMDRILKACGDFAVNHNKAVLLLTALILALGIIGITRMKITHHVLHWFPENSEIRTNTEMIDKEMNGSLALEVVLDTGKENGLYEPEFLNRLELLADRVMEYEPEVEGVFIGKTIDLTDILKEINQALNNNDPEYYAIPQNRKLVAQELFLFENSGSDDLEDMVDSPFSKTHLTIKVPWNDTVSFIGFFSYLSEQLETIFGDDVETEVTGIMQLMMTTVYAMMKSTMNSYAIAVVVITLLMIILIGKLSMGLLSMIPNLTPIITTLGIMGWFGINLDMFSMLIGSIAIGLAVDDTIHFFHNFKKYYDATGKVKTAVEETLTSTGRAMLVTTLVLATGFWLFMFATMQNLFYFGLLTGMTLIFAFLADIIIAPALMRSVIRADKS